jgi:hypothetical protein
MRLVDATPLECQAKERKENEWNQRVSPTSWAHAEESFLHRIEDAPTVDAVVVTRCKECEQAERYERTDGTVGYYCGHPRNTFTYGEHWDRTFKPAKEADDFCSYGERKDGKDG